MFLTETDIINMQVTAGAGKNTSNIIKELIDGDLSSGQKKRMAEGKRYYLGEHDILNKDFRKSYITSTDGGYDGEETEKTELFVNPNRSNERISNQFHRILIDQKAAYIAGREPTVSVKGAEKDGIAKAYETALTDFADEKFNDVILSAVKGAGNKGFETIHVYYGADGNLNYCIVPAEEVIPIYDTEYQEELKELIRYYSITVLKDGRQCLRKRVEWWTKEDVTYYEETEENIYIRDISRSINPSPHFWQVTSLNGLEQRRTPHSWGRVPFIILKNNDEMTTDLQKVKGLIDAYDLISSQGTNDLLDLVALYWVIQGYGGETANSIARKLQLNRAVNVIGSDGGKISAEQVDIPVTGRLEWLKMLRRDIFNFGMGIDVDSDRFGNAPSGVSLKFQYTLLDLKANAVAAKLKRAVKELLWYVTEDINRKNGTSYDSGLIEVGLNKTMITNDMETVQILTQSKGLISDKTIIARHPFVDDVNEELKELEAQEKKEQEKWEENMTARGGEAVER